MYLFTSFSRLACKSISYSNWFRLNIYFPISSFAVSCWRTEEAFGRGITSPNWQSIRWVQGMTGSLIFFLIFHLMYEMKLVAWLNFVLLYSRWMMEVYLTMRGRSCLHAVDTRRRPGRGSTIPRERMFNISWELKVNSNYH